MKNIFLVIDDDEEFLDMIMTFCLKRKFRDEMKYFVDAFEAMQFLTKHRADVQIVFTDYNMKQKGFSGNIIVEKCKELEISVFVVTADVQLINNPGNLQVIEKMSSIAQIVSIIEEAQ